MKQFDQDPIIQDVERNNFLRRIGATLALGIAVVGGTTACDYDSYSAPDAESSAVTPEHYADSFKDLEKPVEVIAQPLVITEDAKQRQKGSDIVFGSDISLYDSNPAKEATTVQSKIKSKLWLTTARREASLLLDGLIADAVGDVSISVDDYEGVKTTIHKNVTEIAKARSLADTILSSRVRGLSEKAIDLDIANEVITSLDEGETKLKPVSTELLTEISDPALQSEAKQMIADTKREAFDTTFSDRADIIDQKISSFTDGGGIMHGGTSSDARYANEELVKFNKARAAQTDETMPALKSIVYEALPTVVELNEGERDDIAHARKVLDKTPAKYAALEKLADSAIDQQVLRQLADTSSYDFYISLQSELAEGQKPTKTLEDISKLVDSITDPKAQAQARRALDLKLAQEYNDDDWTERTPAVEQAILSAISSDAIKRLAQNVRGGNYEAGWKLDSLADELDLSIKPYESPAKAALYNGSNKQAKDINKAAADYLKW